MRARGLEARPALLVDQPGGGVREGAPRIAERLAALGLDMERPARAEPLQHIVGPGAGRDELGLGGAFQIGSAKGGAALEAAVLVEHHAGRDQRRPGQMVGEPVGAVSIFAQA